MSCTFLVLSLAVSLVAADSVRPIVERQLPLEEDITDKNLDGSKDSPRERRFLWGAINSLLGQAGNLTAILQRASLYPSPTLTFVPLVTLLAATPGANGATNTAGSAGAEG